MYTLRLERRARKDLQRLDATIQTQILDKLQWLCENCRTYKHKPLKGPLRGTYSYRAAGNYRALYNVNKDVREIVVYEIGHRHSIY